MVEETEAVDKQLSSVPPQLTPWQPGESGNPHGRPPNKASITYQIKKLLAAGEGIKAEELAKTAVEEARKGSFPHLKEVLDRTDGKLGDVNVVQDNRQFNIIVRSEESKKLLEQAGERLQSTRRPLELEGNSNLPPEEETDAIK